MLSPDTRFLLVLMGSIGDVARGLCLPPLIKKNLPASHITWVIEPKSHPLLLNNPYLDDILVFERTRKAHGILKFIRELRSRRFDVCLDLQRHLKSGLISALSISKRRIGFNRKNAKEFNWLFNGEKIRFIPDTVPKLEHYCEFLRYLGITVKEDLEFGFNLDGLLPEELTDPDFNFIALVLGSSWRSKDWSLSRYGELITLILKTSDLGVVLLGDRSKANDGLKLKRLAASERVVNLAGKTSLSVLPVILNRAAAAAGPDSGPGHIAGATGTPYVTLFGPTSPDRVAPYRCRRFVVNACLPCSPCGKKVCPGLNNLCMRSISAEMVWRRLKEAVPQPSPELKVKATG